jgi:membrane peptidoglycan carboxypeptidase
MHPMVIRYVLDSQRKLIEENAPQGRQVLSPAVAYVITHMLQGTIERGTGVAAKALGRPAAAKTGTTNDYSNAWFIGYTPKLATGVWVGYDRPRSLGRDETGSRVAVPIWTTFMAGTLAGTAPEDFPVPENVALVPVDLSAGGGCARPVTMAFVAGTEPTSTCGPVRYSPGSAPAQPPASPGSAPAQPAAPGSAPGQPASPGSAQAQPARADSVAAPPPVGPEAPRAGPAAPVLPARADPAPPSSPLGPPRTGRPDQAAPTSTLAPRALQSP